MGSRQQSVFTLVELMIVVAIVAILAAIAIPYLADHRYKAERSEAETNTRALSDSVRLVSGQLATDEQDCIPQHPRADGALDKTAVAWTTPTWSSPCTGAIQFVPDGKVRCSYAARAQGDGNNAVEARCDVDDDNTIYDQIAYPVGNDNVERVCLMPGGGKCTFGIDADCNCY